MKNQKLKRAGFFAGLALFCLVTILAACETKNVMSNINKGSRSVTEFQTSLNVLNISTNLL